MIVKDTVGKVYELTQNANGIWVWVDGQKMYDQAKVNNSNSYTSSSSSKYSGSSGTYSPHESEPYDVYDYDDPDDFAEEWAEEFGDDLWYLFPMVTLIHFSYCVSS